VSPGNTTALVRWRAPTSNGGSAITNYVVIPYAGTTALAKKVVGPVAQTTITGLTNAKAYSFRVSAVTAAETGAARASAAVVIGAPVAPRGVMATQIGGDKAGTATAVLRWTADANNGSAIKAYVVTTYANGVAESSHGYAAPATSASVGNLSYGTSYSFRVAATNARGAGPASAASVGMALRCVGRPMPKGQSDIDAAPGGTTFCLSGTHNWTLTPKSGDRFIGPAVLDGAHKTVYAILGGGTSDVVLAALEVRNYNVADPDAAIAGHGTTGWMFRDLSVHDNGAGAAGGDGAQLGVRSRVVGGRYFNNREVGIGGGGGANGWVITGAEIDHNNFTDDRYTTRNINCGYQAGGVKWTADNATIQNSNIHDNACKGLWADLNADNAKILDNRVVGNWDEGILVEISSRATVTGNTVSRNGLHNYNGSGSGCPWLWGGGITLASSDHAVVANNKLSGNCNGITGTQQNRSDGHPGLLAHADIHDNVIVGPGGKTGAASDNGANLASRDIVFSDNSFQDHTFCSTHC
jgi:parallel beta-helix repeat protein